MWESGFSGYQYNGLCFLPCDIYNFLFGNIFCIYYTYSLLSGWGQAFRYSQELQAQYQQVILKTRLAIRFGRSFPGNGASGF